MHPSLNETCGPITAKGPTVTPSANFASGETEACGCIFAALIYPKLLPRARGQSSCTSASLPPRVVRLRLRFLLSCKNHPATPPQSLPISVDAPAERAGEIARRPQPPKTAICFHDQEFRAAAKARPPAPFLR